MGIRTERRTIDGHVYEVRQLGFHEGRRALVRFLKFIGPALANFLTGETKLGVSASGEAEIDGEAVGNVIREFLERLDEDELAYFCELFGQQTDVSAQPGSSKMIALDTELQDIHFAGRYGAATRWLIFCVEVNFGGFFKGAGALAGIGRNLASAAPSPS